MAAWQSERTHGARLVPLERPNDFYGDWAKETPVLTPVLLLVTRIFVYNARDRDISIGVETRYFGLSHSLLSSNLFCYDL